MRYKREGWCGDDGWWCCLWWMIWNMDGYYGGCWIDTIFLIVITDKSIHRYTNNNNEISIKVLKVLLIPLMVFSCDTVPLSNQPWCFWAVSFPNADLAFNVFQQIRIWGKMRRIPIQAKFYGIWSKTTTWIRTQIIESKRIKWVWKRCNFYP